MIERRRAHRIRVLHGGTGRPYPAITARLVEPAWPHWHLKVSGADVVLAADAERLAGAPPSTLVEIAVDDPAARERFLQATRRVSLPRGARDMTVTLAAAPARIEISVFRLSGDPAPHLRVELIPLGGGAAIPAAAAGSHVYRTAPTAFDPADAPFAINVEHKRRGSVAPDPALPVTRVRLIEP